MRVELYLGAYHVYREEFGSSNKESMVLSKIELLTDRLIIYLHFVRNCKVPQLRRSTLKKVEMRIIFLAWITVGLKT